MRTPITHVRMMRAFSAVLTLALLAACSEIPPEPRAKPANVSQGATQGSAAAATTSTVTWLGPLGTARPEPSTFDATASPVVEICPWSGTSCAGPAVARFNLTAGAGDSPLTVNTVAGQYEGSWNLLNPIFTTRKTYRIRILQGTTEVGAVSVDVVRGRWALTAADGTTAPLSSANALPIWFALYATTALVPAAQDAVVLAKALLTSSNPVADFTSFTAALGELYAALGAESAQRQANLIDSAAFDPITDAAALRSLNIALGGQVITLKSPQSATVRSINPPSPPVRQQFAIHSETDAGRDNSLAARLDVSQLPSSSVAGPLPVTVIYINGVDNDPTLASNSAQRLSGVLQGALGWTFNTGSRHDIKLVYNPSAAFAEGISERCVVIAREDNTGGLCIVADLAQAILQVAHLAFNFPVGAQPAAQRLADEVRNQWAQGHGVVLIGHSQGNLMIQEALRLLPPERLLRCTGVVSVAAPRSDLFSGTLASLSGLISEGTRSNDVLLDVNGVVNTFPHFRNNVTTVFDAGLAALEAAGFGPTTARYLKTKVIDYDLTIHGFSNSYLSSPTTALAIAANVNAADGAVFDNCPELVVTPSPAQVDVGSQIQLSAKVVDPAGNIMDRIITWEPFTPEIATVNSVTGLVTGVQAGTAIVYARSGGTFATVTVTVNGAATVSISPHSPVVQPGQHISLSASVAGLPTGSHVTWRSLDPLFATVVGSDRTASVSGVRVGVAHIVATAGAAEDTVPVTVGQISISPHAVPLQPGQQVSLTASVSGLLPGALITWQSLDDPFATVLGTNTTATVTGVAAGTARIVATAGTIKDTALVTVTGNVAVRLSPSGDVPVGSDPYTIQVVNDALQSAVATEDITVTLLRTAHACIPGLFPDQTLTVTVPKGDTTATFGTFVPGRPLACFGTQIAAKYTITGAVLGTSTPLNLSKIPPAQLSVNIIR